MKEDRVLNPDECRDLLEAYSKKHRDCEEAVEVGCCLSQGKFLIQLEIDLEGPIPVAIVVEPTKLLDLHIENLRKENTPDDF